MTYSWDRKTTVGRMVGLTMKSVTATGNEVTFVSTIGITFTLCHMQSCCESVDLIDVVGGLDDLVGSPILLAEESSSNDRPADVAAPQYEPESQTWTFYKFATIKGYVDLRWCGKSNGYYSEEVDCLASEPLCNQHKDCLASVALAATCMRRGAS